MADYDSNDQTPQDQRIEGALEVVSDAECAVVRLGNQQHPVPMLRSTTAQLDGVNAFLANTQLGAIERKKQRDIRRLLATAEIEVLRTRVEAIRAAHAGITKAALEEILVAAEVFGRESIRRYELQEQASVDRAVHQAAIQFRDHLASLEPDLPPVAQDTLCRAAEQNFLAHVEKIRSASFRIAR